MQLLTTQLTNCVIFQLIKWPAKLISIFHFNLILPFSSYCFLAVFISLPRWHYWLVNIGSNTSGKLAAATLFRLRGTPVVVTLLAIVNRFIFSSIWPDWLEMLTRQQDPVQGLLRVILRYFVKLENCFCPIKNGFREDTIYDDPSIL